MALGGLLRLELALDVLVPLEQPLEVELARVALLLGARLDPLAQRVELLLLAPHELHLGEQRVLLGLALAALRLLRLERVGARLELLRVGVVALLRDHHLLPPQVEQLLRRLRPVRRPRLDALAELVLVEQVALAHRVEQLRRALVVLAELLVPQRVELLELEHLRLLDALALRVLPARDGVDLPALRQRAQLRQPPLRDVRLDVLALALALLPVRVEHRDELAQRGVVGVGGRHPGAQFAGAI